ncbi:MAG: hypothetical protein EOL88_04975 [Bacteroidia bacterium]|nr:hypothetical protein [Bacteroidales bacterium]NCD41427.1 hypothetical protein [Bacteroidia bacterium]
MAFKNKIPIALTLMLITIIIVAASITGRKNRTQPCCSIEVIYENSRNDTLVLPEEIIRIANSCCDSIINCPLNKIDNQKVRNTLLQSPYIEEAQISFGLTGVMKLYITQTTVIARIINTAGHHYYLSRSGRLMPTEQRTARVMVFNGYISPLPDDCKSAKETGNTLYHQIFELASGIHQDDFMRTLTDQVYVTRMKNFELIPKIGIQKIMLNTTTHLDSKFENLALFYRQKLPHLERSTYKALDISFDNQIIAKK